MVYFSRIDDNIRVKITFDESILVRVSFDGKNTDATSFRPKYTPKIDENILLLILFDYNIRPRIRRKNDEKFDGMSLTLENVP